MTAGIRAPWTERMYEALSDGEWHLVSDIIEEMCKDIDPGRASRQDVLSGSTQARILAGKRRIASGVIRSLAYKHRIEVDRPPNEKDARVRLAEQLRRWDTARLSKHLDRPQTTVQSWFGNAEAVALIQAQLPEGMQAVHEHPTGGRARTTPAEAIPYWEKYAETRRVLRRRRSQADADEAVVAAVGRALDLPRPEAEKATQRLQEELAGVELAIYAVRT